MVATARDARATRQRFGVSGHPHISLLGTVPWGQRWPLCPHHLPFATISLREELHRAVPPSGTSWRYPGASPLLRGPFFGPFLHPSGILKRGLSGRGGWVQGRAVSASRGWSAAARQMANSGRGSCCHGDAKLHPVAAATKVKKLMLRQENHMMRFFFV